MNKILCIAASASGFLALLLIVMAGPSYRFGILELGAAFTLLRWGAYLGVASVALIIGYALWTKPGPRLGSVLLVSALAGLLAFAIPLSQMRTARSVPPIHDISTDLANPPEFIDIAPLRANAPNPAAYAGEEVALQQRRAYPNIATLQVPAPLERVLAIATELANARGWELVAAALDDDTARLEATDTSFWFGFKDDVVIRMTAIEDGTLIDMRSKSRVGRGDLGVNAQRVQQYLAELERRIIEGR